MEEKDLTRPLRILLFCDASNMHNCLAKGLRDKGHEVVVASDGGRWMDTERDIRLNRPFDNPLGGALLWHKVKRLQRRRLTGFDIVAVSNATFPLFRPRRSLAMLERLAASNANIFTTMLGTDTPYVEECLRPDSALKYSEWMCNGEPTPYLEANRQTLNEWLSPELRQLYGRLYGLSRGVATALYEYDATARRFLPSEKVIYTGIPIDVKSITPVELPDKIDKVKLFLGMHADKKIEKGTDRLLCAAKRVSERFPDKCTLEIVENLPYSQYIERQRNAHVVLDQLYSYTPATNAMLAMAAGLNAVSGAEPEFYDFIGETSLRPIINAIPDDEALFATLSDIVARPELIRPRGIQSRLFVEKHNSLETVANRFLNLWLSKIDKLNPT